MIADLLLQPLRVVQADLKSNGIEISNCLIAMLYIFAKRGLKIYRDPTLIERAKDNKGYICNSNCGSLVTEVLFSSYQLHIRGQD